MSPRLPSGLPDPLHLLQPFPWEGLVPALLLLLAAYLVQRWRRARRRAPAKAPARTAARPRRGSELAQAVEKIRHRHLRAETYRLGCHELAATLRTQLEAERSQPLTRLTAREIRRILGETPLSRLFDRLDNLQFRRRPPRRHDFRGVCDEALEVVHTKKPNQQVAH